MFGNILKLIFPTMITVILAVVFYILKRKTNFVNLPYKAQQIILGVAFGLSSILGTELGVNLGSAVVNVRDAAPIVAGLLFGGPAGAIAGVIGGIERFFSVYWGVGAYTQIACSVSTVVAGFYAAFLRRYLFEYKRPNALFGAVTGLVLEVFHMVMVFVTHISDAENAFEVVRACTGPMIALNSAAVALSCFLVALISKELHMGEKRKKTISQKIQTRLLIVILIGYATTTAFVYALQTNTAYREAESLLKLSTSDISMNISSTADEDMRDVAYRVKQDIEANPTRSITAIASSNGVREINIVNDKGIITQSTNPAYNGFDMASGEQSREFLSLLNGKNTLVQEYRPTTYNSFESMKYAGISTKSGFIQVGHDKITFHKAIADKIAGDTVNIHIGKTGYVIIADEDFSVVSKIEGYTGSNLYDTGISIDLETMHENTRYKATVLGDKSFFSYVTQEGFYIIGVYPQEEAFAQRTASTYVNSFMEVLIFALLFFVIYRLINKNVVKGVQRVNNSLSRIREGDLNTVVDERKTEEFSNLSDDINSTVATLNEYIKDAESRIDKELALAKAIQHSALPNIFPAFPNLPEFDIYASMDTAKEVGGDFYDFYMVGENKLAFLVADVSGKGIPAAMFMMTAKTMIKNYAETGMAIDQVMTEANARLCEGNDAGMFVTAWFGIIDILSGHVDFVNAGHNPPLVMHKDGGYSYLKSKAGFVLAGLEDFKYVTQTVDLEPGDKIFLYTDGVTEATDNNNKLYGEERLRTYLNSDLTLSPKETLQGVKADVDKFVDGAEQFDDITMLLVEYIGREEAVSLKEKVFPAKDEELENVISFIQAELEKTNCDMGLMNRIAIVTEEIFVNIAHYAYGDKEGTVNVGVSTDNSKLTVRFQDKGKPFDPLAKTDPDVTLSAEERNIGGLGIFMVKKMMDDVKYEYVNGQNILTLIKNI